MSKICDEDVTSHVVSAHGEGSSRNFDRVKRYKFVTLLYRYSDLYIRFVVLI